MPKNPNTLITPNKNKYFVYETQSPKKTHCNKTINNYNYHPAPTEFLSIRPNNHWTGNKNDIKWEYYSFLTTQLILSISEFQRTRNWNDWNNFQRNHHILKNLIHNSINLTYYTPQEARHLDEITKGQAPTEQTGKEANQQ
jgi:hypothetical protein